MEQQSKRIVITQVTTINAIGTSFTQTEECLHNPPQLTPVQSFQFHHLSQPVDCYRIRNLDPKEILGKKGLRNKDWATRLLLCALQSGFYPLLEETPEEQRPGLCIGTAFGSVESIGDFLSDSIENGVNSVNPQEFANTVINSPTGNANIRYGLRNLSSTVATGFNASLDAIIYACRY